MGLDITAISHAKRVGNLDAVLRLYDDCDGVGVYLAEGVPNLLDGKPPGRYKGRDIFEFRAGSYSGYNAWREWLCKTFLDVAPEVVWKRPKKFAGKPFVELINFSDCEGAMGPITCSKLYLDFSNKTFEEAAELACPNGYDYDDRYKNWMKAFEIGSKDGFVTFH